MWRLLITPTIIFPIIVAGAAAFGSITFFYYEEWWGLIVLAGSLLTLLGLGDVPSDPPHIAIPTVWTIRIPIILREGKKLFAPYPPFFIYRILVNVVKKNNDFTFDDIWCRFDGSDESSTDSSAEAPEKDGAQRLKIGGRIEMEVSITWEPDTSSAKRIFQYLNSSPPDESGSQPEGGVVAIIRDMLAEDARQMGSYRTWVEAVLSKDMLSAILIVKMTGMSLPVYVRDDQGAVILEDDPERPGKKTPRIEGYYTLDSMLTGKMRPREEDVDYFLKHALVNGVGDVHDLGIRIRRLNVTRATPLGDLLRDAEKAALEEQQRRAERHDNDTGILLANALLAAAEKSDDKDSFWRAHEASRITRGLAQEVVIRGAEGNPFASGATVHRTLNGGES